MTACLSYVLGHFDSGMRRNQNFEILDVFGCESDLCLEAFWFLEFFFAFPFSPFLFAAVIDLLLGLLAIKNLLRKRHRDGQFVPWSSQDFGLSFALNFWSILIHISGSIRPITQIWVSLERSFPPAEVEYRWCQFGSKVMTSEVEERPRLFTAGYGRHRS